MPTPPGPEDVEPHPAAQEPAVTDRVEPDATPPDPAVPDRAQPDTAGTAGGSTAQAVVAGIVTSTVGFTSSFAVVLAGLRAVGASPDQASSGLLAVCVAMGLGTLVLSWRTRLPITLAWSTPGAALLASAATPHLGFRGAVGAFVVAALLVITCAVVRPLGRWVARIPTAIASAMLAGVLLTLCVEPFRAAVAQPAAVLPVIAVWLLLTRLAPRWAVPGALLAAVVVMVVVGAFGRLTAGDLVPRVQAVVPALDPAAVVALGIPLFLVTMTSQNIPGIAVLASFGYRAPVATVLGYTGTASVGTALLGGHTINFAAISAALAAGPSAHPDPARRWIAGVATGTTTLVIAPLSAAIAAVATVAPAGLMATIAGLALIGAFAGAARTALTDPDHRDAAAVTFLIGASQITVAGIGAAFWALLGGGLYLLVTRLPGRRLR